MQVKIRIAQTPEIIDLRWEILRAGLPRESAFFDGDNEPTTRHVVAISDGLVIGCVTILHRDWENGPAWQLRGMAVAKDLQQRGIGRELLAGIEQIVQDEPHSLRLWCNARTPATGFYEKLGWQRLGQEFVIPSAGPHYKMTKLLKNPAASVR